MNGNVAGRIREWIAEWPLEPSPKALFRVLRYLSQWRAIMLANTHVKQCGATVYGGPFKGMTYAATSAEGALMPRLLGTYESELHPHLEALLADKPERIIDVGCAEGYYAVGLARLAPDVIVHAFDIDAAARTACAALAEANGVADRVVIGGAFSPAGFQDFAAFRTLVIVDIEGAELDLLRPDLAPALAQMTLIVETHDVHRRGALDTLIDRFSRTHDMLRVDQQPKTYEMPPWLRSQTHLDQLLAVWEWRVEPTPWLVMRPKAPA